MPNNTRCTINRRRLLLALACVLLSAATADAAPSPPPPAPSSTAASPDDNDGTAQASATTLPLTLVSGHGFFLLHLRLNGTTDATFVVDTGTNACLISQSLAQRLGLTPSPAVWQGKPVMRKGKQESGITVDDIEFPGARVMGKMPIFKSDMIALPDNAFVLPPNVARPHDSNTFYDGIFGAGLFKSFAACFDFTAHTLTLYWPGSFSARQARLVGCLRPGGASLPLTLSQDQVAHDRFDVPVSLTSGGVTRQISLTVDTGADTTVITRSLARDLSLKKTGQMHQYNVGKDFISNMVVVPSVGLGDVTVQDTLVAYPQTEGFLPVLGMDVLSRYRVLLDFPGKTMYLAPETTPVAVPLPAK